MTTKGLAPLAHRTQQERDRLVEKFLPLVRYVAARLPVTMPAALNREDFYSIGVMGLMHAANTYDPSRGASFKTFAYTAIRGAILDEIRRHDPVPRSRRDRLRRIERAAADLQAELDRAPTLEELADRLDVSAESLDDDLLALHTCKILSLDEGASTAEESTSSLGNTLASPEANDPRDRAEMQEQIERLSAAIAKLPKFDRDVVILYHYENLYLKEIGEILGVSESRVSQILSRAMARLRLYMKDGEET